MVKHRENSGKKWEKKPQKSVRKINTFPVKSQDNPRKIPLFLVVKKDL